MLITRRGFAKRAASCCAGLAVHRLQAWDDPREKLPNPVFAYEFGEITPKQQAAFARESAFAGTVFDHAKLIPERMQALDEAHLQLFFLWLTVDLGRGGIAYEPGWEAAIEALAGRGTVVWIALQGDATQNGAETERRAVQAIRRVSDVAAEANLRVALYPHYGFYLARFGDVVRAAERAERSNVGVTFNLCHELRSGFEADFPELLKRSIPRLYGVTINGADRNGRDWDRLIQPLGRGDYDVAGLVRSFVRAGYRGPFGIQCYGLKGDPGVYLKQSMTAWRGIAASGTA